MRPDTVGMPVESARAALRATARLISLDADAAETLPLIRRRESISATHLTFEATAGGIPVDRGRVTVHVDRSGTVRLITADHTEMHGLRRPTFTRSDSEVIDAAVRSLEIEGALRGAVTVRRVAYPTEKNSLRAGWRVGIPATVPLGDWDVLVDDATLDTIEVGNLLRYVDGGGHVFDPNPVVALQDSSLEDENDSADAVPGDAYTFVTLRDLDGSGYLTGPYVATTPTANRAYEPLDPPSGLSFKYDREDDRFEEVMAYYHIDSYQRYIQQLGFDNVCNLQTLVNVNSTTQDNSFYSPMTGTIMLGSGGVDDGEDADIIVHEYGHAIQTNVISDSFGASPEASSIAEGISDYLPASYFAHFGYTPTYIGEWDATSYTSWRPAYLRRVDTTKRYPDDMTGEEHDDGEIYSSALWHVRASVGQTVADQLVIESMFYMSADASFLEGRGAMMLADESLFGGAHADVIAAAFDARGIMVPAPVDGDLFMRDETPDLPIPDNNTLAVSSTIFVPTDVAVTALAVTVDITHPYIGDLEIWLRSPDGTDVKLHDRSGGESDDLHVTYSLDRLPDGPGSLDDFVGLQSRGTWTLRVRDMGEADVGTLNWWQLEIAPTMLTPPPPPVIDTNSGEDFETMLPEVQIAGSTVLGTVSIEVNGSTEGVSFEYGTAEWVYEGPLALGENVFDVTAVSETAESESVSVTVTYIQIQYSKFDINRDHTVNAIDIQRVINGAIGLPPTLGDADTDVNSDGTVDAVDLQLCVNAALGL